MDAGNDENMFPSNGVLRMQRPVKATQHRKELYVCVCHANNREEGSK